MAAAKDFEASIERDVRTYLAELPDLLKAKEEGRFVLIARADKIKVFDSREEAMQVGNARFRQVGFIVRQICEQDKQLAQEWLDACPS